MAGDEAKRGRFDVRTIATLLMLDERRIQQLTKEGWIKKDDRGSYGLVESVQGYIRYLKENTKSRERGTEHARLARAQSMKVEMENWRRMGELQTSSHVEETTNGLVVILKSSTEGLPGRIANELAAITEPPLVYKRLQTELRSIVDQCADFLAKRADTLEAMPEPGREFTSVSETDADDLGAEESGDAAGQS